MTSTHPDTDETPIVETDNTAGPDTDHTEPADDDLDAIADEIHAAAEALDRAPQETPRMPTDQPSQDYRPSLGPVGDDGEPVRASMPFTPTDPLHWPDPSATTRTVHDWPPDVVGPLLVDRLGIDRLRQFTHAERVEALHRTIERLVVDAVTPHDHIEAAKLMAWRVDVRLHEHDPNLPPPVEYSGPVEQDPDKVPSAFDPDLMGR